MNNRNKQYHKCYKNDSKAVSKVNEKYKQLKNIIEIIGIVRMNNYGKVFVIISIERLIDMTVYL